MTKKIWGGRFSKEMDPLLKDFSYSLGTDGELFTAEIQVNEAWVKMLAKIKILTQAESAKLLRGIRSLSKDFASVDFGEMKKQYEDVHALIQICLEKKVGPLAKKLHTGRSRNDLVVTSTRIYLKEKADFVLQGITQTQSALISLAEKAGDTVVAGMTHLRLAQPVLFAHHLLAYVEMLEEDKSRLLDAKKRLDVLPLGSAAIGGSSLPIDQRFLARELEFSKIATNSMAAVSDRAFMTELLSHLALLWMHLSRLSEDFILWNSEAFHYIELDDAFSTGSSLMPQKKNPDIFELIRGRSGVIFGYLQSHLTMQKGLPLAYNRDLQEDKPVVFDAFRKTESALALLVPALRTTTLHPESMELSVGEDVLFATDILEYLVRKKVAFAEAHEIVGKIVRYAADQKKPLHELSVSQWQKFHPGFDDRVYALFESRTSVKAKKTIGSTNPVQVKFQIGKWKQALKKKG